jgi:hypothetical protein
VLDLRFQVIFFPHNNSETLSDFLTSNLFRR